MLESTNPKAFSIADCPLGKQVPYPTHYDPSVLFAIPRPWSREKTFAEELAAGQTLPPFAGADLWNDYEFSFIDPVSGQRQLRFLQVVIPSESPFLIESKSFKLYLFSFANAKLSEQEIIKRIETDAQAIVKRPVLARLWPLHAALFKRQGKKPQGLPLDGLSPCQDYELRPDLLRLADQQDGEQTHAFWLANFRSLCLVSGKPDWAQVMIEWQGQAIDPASLCRYLVSFRNHQGIHEQCMERIFFDLQRLLAPRNLRVMGFFTRRGGLDINPIRQTNAGELAELAGLWQRHTRQ